MWRRTGFALPVLAAGALLLSACAQRPRPQPAPAAMETVVQPGETILAVARRTQIPGQVLIEANGLRPPYLLRTGQRLIVPGVRYHLVEPGQNLASLSRSYGVSRDLIARLNSLSGPADVSPGQVLVLPGTPASIPQAFAAGTGPAQPPTPPEPADLVTLRPPLPPLPTLPPPVPAVPAAPGRSTAVVSEPAPPPPIASRAPSLPTPAAERAPEPAPAAAPQIAPPLARVEEPAAREPEVAMRPPPRAARQFLWPVLGPIVSDFGGKAGGLQNDGLNIGAPRGTAFRAAENGVVAYVGNEVPGFGNLIVIRHADGWTTLYAHADEVLVKRGAEVRRGQTIGRIGGTGAVSAPQLHFEVRRNNRPVNPREHLAPQTAQIGG